MTYSFLTLAKDVLEVENVPLSIEEIWESAKKLGLLEKLSSSGKTPIRTLSAKVYVDIKNNTGPMSILWTKKVERLCHFF